MTNISRRRNNVRGMFADCRNQTSGDSDGMSSHLRTFSYPSECLRALLACAHWAFGGASETTLANGQYDSLAILVGDLIRQRVSVIAATSTPANLVAKASTSTIPIVFVTGGDPVQLGLVSSLSRPGGNVTGVTQMTGEVAPKRVKLAQELVPQTTSIGLLINPKNPLAEMEKRDSLAAAETRDQTQCSVRQQRCRT